MLLHVRDSWAESCARPSCASWIIEHSPRAGRMGGGAAALPRSRTPELVVEVQFDPHAAMKWPRGRVGQRVQATRVPAAWRVESSSPGRGGAQRVPASGGPHGQASHDELTVPDDLTGLGELGFPLPRESLRSSRFARSSRFPTRGRSTRTSSVMNGAGTSRIDDFDERPGKVGHEGRRVVMHGPQWETLYL